MTCTCHMHMSHAHVHVHVHVGTHIPAVRGLWFAVCGLRFAYGHADHRESHTSYLKHSHRSQRSWGGQSHLWLTAPSAHTHSEKKASTPLARSHLVLAGDHLVLARDHRQICHTIWCFFHVQANLLQIFPFFSPQANFDSNLEKSWAGPRGARAWLGSPRPRRSEPEELRRRAQRSWRQRPCAPCTRCASPRSRSSWRRSCWRGASCHCARSNAWPDARRRGIRRR